MPAKFLASSGPRGAFVHLCALKQRVAPSGAPSMPRLVQRSVSQPVKRSLSERNWPLPSFVHFQLSKSVEQPRAGPQWVHEIKLDGFRMAARIDNGRVQLLTRTGLDWTAKYPGA